jgi:hypothetical protein
MSSLAHVFTGWWLSLTQPLVPNVLTSSTAATQIHSYSQSYFATGDLPPISQFWHQAPWGTWPDIFRDCSCYITLARTAYKTSFPTVPLLLLAYPLPRRRVYRPLPSNGRLTGSTVPVFQLPCHNIYRHIYFQPINMTPLNMRWRYVGENRSFNSEWDFVYINKGGKPLCHVCSASLSHYYVSDLKYQHARCNKCTWHSNNIFHCAAKLTLNCPNRWSICDVRQK